MGGFEGRWCCRLRGGSLRRLPHPGGGERNVGVACWQRGRRSPGRGACCSNRRCGRLGRPSPPELQGIEEEEGAVEEEVDKGCVLLMTSWRVRAAVRNPKGSPKAWGHPPLSVRTPEWSAGTLTCTEAESCPLAREHHDPKIVPMFLPLPPGGANRC